MIYFVHPPGHFLSSCLCLDFYALVQPTSLECLSVVEMIPPIYENFQPLVLKIYFSSLIKSQGFYAYIVLFVLLKITSVAIFR